MLPARSVSVYRANTVAAKRSGEGAESRGLRRTTQLARRIPATHSAIPNHLLLVSWTKTGQVSTVAIAGDTYERNESMTANRSRVAQPVDVDIETLRDAIKGEYKEVADHPGKGFHFHTGRRLTKIVGYQDEWFEGVSELAIESFAGTGNPFAMGALAAGERVVDVGSGGGIDSLIAARMVGPTGQVVGVAMTPEMLEKARAAAAESGIDNVEFREAYM